MSEGGWAAASGRCGETRSEGCNAEVQMGEVKERGEEDGGEIPLLGGVAHAHALRGVAAAAAAKGNCATAAKNAEEASEVLMM